MGLENLKSIFTEGISKFNNTDVTKMVSEHKVGFPGPVNTFKDTHATGFTLNLSGTTTQYKTSTALPVLDSMLLTNLSELNSTLAIGGDTFTQDDAFGDGTLFQQNFEELSQTQLEGLSSTLTIGGGTFTQPDVFGDGTLFQQNFKELSQTQLALLSSTLTIGGGIFTQPDAFGDGTLFQKNFQELSQTQLEGLSSTLTIGGGIFTQDDAFGDGHLFKQNFQELSQTQLEGMVSTLTTDGGTFTQPDAFGDGTLFQKNFQELSQTQLVASDVSAGLSSTLTIGGGTFTQGDAFGDGILFQQNMYPDGFSQLLELNGTSVFQQGMGGLFNASTAYASSKFLFPISANVPSIEQILTEGNIGDTSIGIASGGGFPLQKTSYDKLDVTNIVGEDTSLSGFATQAVDGYGTLLSAVTDGRKFPSDTSWSDLYNPDHTSKGVDGHQYSYGSNVNLIFGIRDEAPNIRHTGLSFSRGDEPYNVSNIGDRLWADRSIPITRAIDDVERVGSYMLSPSGIGWMVKENLYNIIGINVGAEEDTDGNRTGKLERKVQKNLGLNPLSTLGSVGGRLLGEGVPNILFDRTDPIWINQMKYTKNNLGSAGTIKTDTVSETFTGGNKLNNHDSDIPQKDYTGNGDKMTLASMISGYNLGHTAAGTQTIHTVTGVYGTAGVDIESEKNGMPFYFKDLRDDTYIFFRAYIDGLTENISPSWAPTNYLGRSEPVYVYERSERDISFNLKLFAQTETELTSIYQKMNRLTSLCYPEYAKDEVGGVNAMQRMKPPLTKFRLGELFGTSKNELTGFIKSLSYTYPQESPWETKQGKRVPKYIQVAISYQVIHMTVPSLDFVKKAAKDTFYGLTHQQLTNNATETAGHIGTGID